MMHIVKQIISSISVLAVITGTMIASGIALTAPAAALSSTPTTMAAACTEDNCNLVAIYLNPLLNVLTGLVGVIAVASIIYGGIQYSSAGGDPQKVSQAKTRITNTVLALVGYAFLYGFLQFIVPGGVFAK